MEIATSIFTENPCQLKKNICMKVPNVQNFPLPKWKLVGCFNPFEKY